MIRIGMIVPSSNTAVEIGTHCLLAERGDITFVTTRIRVQTITGDGAGAAFDLETMLGAARLLADARVDVIVWNGTSGSWLGVTHDESICTAITNETEIPSTTATLAILNACETFGVRALAIATPYTADIVERIIVEYRRSGIDVVSHAEWGLQDNYSFAAADDADVARLLSDAARCNHPDAVAMVCTNVDATPVIPAVESALGMPVIDSIAASLWWAVALAGGALRFTDRGRLLGQGSLRLAARAISARLRTELDCARVTVRADLPDLGIDVDSCLAESRASGQRSMQQDGPADQRSMETVNWLLGTGEVLVQDDFTRPPFPPETMHDLYGVRAQMLGPVLLGERIVAWMSVHSVAERHWTASDITALRAACRAVASALGN